MKKQPNNSLDQKAWNLLFPDFVFDHMLKHLEVEDTIISHKDILFSIQIAKDLLSIFINQKDIGTYVIDEYFEYFTRMSLLYPKSWVLWICLMAFVNFMKVHFQGIDVKVFDYLAYELMWNN